jgi:hypothetical protein
VLGLASSPEDFKRQLNAQIYFCELHQFMINLSKTKVLIFNTSKDTPEISLIPLIKIFATDLMLCLADLIHWGFLDAFQLCV